MTIGIVGLGLIGGSFAKAYSDNSIRSTQIWGSLAAAISICAVRKKGG